MSIRTTTMADGPERVGAEDAFALETLSPGDRLLLLGSSRQLLEQASRRCIVSNEDAPAGVAVVSTRGLLSDLGANDAVLAADADRRFPADRSASEPRGRRFDGRLDWRVPTSPTLTGVEIAVTRGLASLRRRGVDRPWLIVDSLSPLFGSLDPSTVVRFLHSLAGTVESHDGVGCYVANDGAIAASQLERVKHLANGTIEVRPGRDAGKLRRRGFGERDDGWRSFGPSAPADRRDAPVSPAGD